MSKSATHPDESIVPDQPITGPFVGRDAHGQPDHAFYRCENCGLETTDETNTDDGCFRCGSGPA